MHLETRDQERGDGEEQVLHRSPILFGGLARLGLHHFTDFLLHFLLLLLGSVQHALCILRVDPLLSLLLLLSLLRFLLLFPLLVRLRFLSLLVLLALLFLFLLVLVLVLLVVLVFLLLLLGELHLRIGQVVPAVGVGRHALQGLLVGVHRFALGLLLHPAIAQVVVSTGLCR